MTPKKPAKPKQPGGAKEHLQFRAHPAQLLELERLAAAFNITRATAARRAFARGLAAMRGDLKRPTRGALAPRADDDVT